LARDQFAIYNNVGVPIRKGIDVSTGFSERIDRIELCAGRSK
jgi:hypothetical protein